MNANMPLLGIVSALNSAAVCFYSFEDIMQCGLHPGASLVGRLALIVIFIGTAEAHRECVRID